MTVRTESNSRSNSKKYNVEARETAPANKGSTSGSPDTSSAKANTKTTDGGQVDKKSVPAEYSGQSSFKVAENPPGIVLESAPDRIEGQDNKGAMYIDKITIEGPGPGDRHFDIPNQGNRASMPRQEAAGVLADAYGAKTDAQRQAVTNVVEKSGILPEQVEVRNDNNGVTASFDVYIPEEVDQQMRTAASVRTGSTSGQPAAGEQPKSGGFGQAWADNLREASVTAEAMKQDSNPFVRAGGHFSSTVFKVAEGTNNLLRGATDFYNTHSQSDNPLISNAAKVGGVLTALGSGLASPVTLADPTQSGQEATANIIGTTVAAATLGAGPALSALSKTPVAQATGRTLATFGDDATRALLNSPAGRFVTGKAGEAMEFAANTPVGQAIAKHGPEFLRGTGENLTRLNQLPGEVLKKVSLPGGGNVNQVLDDAMGTFNRINNFGRTPGATSAATNSATTAGNSADNVSGSSAGATAADEVAPKAGNTTSNTGRTGGQEDGWTIKKTSQESLERQAELSAKRETLKAANTPPPTVQHNGRQWDVMGMEGDEVVLRPANAKETFVDSKSVRTVEADGKTWNVSLNDKKDGYKLTSGNETRSISNADLQSPEVSARYTTQVGDQTYNLGPTGYGRTKLNHPEADVRLSVPMKDVGDNLQVRLKGQEHLGLFQVKKGADGGLTAQQIGPGGKLGDPQPIKPSDIQARDVQLWSDPPHGSVTVDPKKLQAANRNAGVTPNSDPIGYAEPSKVSVAKAHELLQETADQVGNMGPGPLNIKMRQMRLETDAGNLSPQAEQLVSNIINHQKTKGPVTIMENPQLPLSKPLQERLEAAGVKVLHPNSNVEGAPFHIHQKGYVGTGADGQPEAIISTAAAETLEKKHKVETNITVKGEGAKLYQDYEQMAARGGSTNIAQQRQKLDKLSNDYGIHVNDPNVNKYHAARALNNTIDSAQTNLEGYVSDLISKDHAEKLVAAAERGVNVDVVVRGLDPDSEKVIANALRKNPDLPLNVRLFEKSEAKAAGRDPWYFHGNTMVADGPSRAERALIREGSKSAGGYDPRGYVGTNYTWTAQTNKLHQGIGSSTEAGVTFKGGSAVDVLNQMDDNMAADGVMLPTRTVGAEAREEALRARQSAR